MENTKTFEQLISRVDDKDLLIAMNESYNEELSPEMEKEIDERIDKFVNSYLEKNKGLPDLEHDILEEGVIGSIFGGLTGFALGKSVGKLIAKVLGVNKKGIFYDMLTSRLVGAALGSSIGSRF